jgi:hypothetical protein
VRSFLGTKVGLACERRVSVGHSLIVVNGTKGPLLGVSLPVRVNQGEFTGSKGVAKHLFSDMPTAATETSPVTMPKMYGKPCRYTLLYGNLKSTVFRLCWSVTCASRPNRIGRSQTYNVMHCWRRASTDAPV